MTLAVSSPEDVINLALARIGYKGRVGSIYEGSMAAKKALDIYSQTRQDIMTAQEWDFSGRDIVLTLLKQAPVGGYIPPTVWSNIYPMLPWMFSYAYPSDCIKVRSVKSTPLFLPNFDPQPRRWSVENDNSLVPPAKVILTNVPNAICVYTGDVTNPQDWVPDFVEAFAAELGRRLAPSLIGLEAAKMAAQDAAGEEAMKTPG